MAKDQRPTEEKVRQVRAEGPDHIRLEPATQTAMDKATAEQPPEGLTPVGLQKTIDNSIVQASADGLVHSGKRLRGIEKARVINTGAFVPARIPLTDVEKRRGAPYPKVTVTIDGYSWEVPKGVTVAVPSQIYDVLAETGQLDL